MRLMMVWQGLAACIICGRRMSVRQFRSRQVVNHKWRSGSNTMAVRKLTLSIALMAIGLPGALGGARAAGDDVIDFNYGIPTGSYAQLYVAEDLGLFAKYKINPTFYSFQSGAPLLAALKSGSLDVVTTGLASVFALGQNIPVRYLYYMGDAAQAEGLVTRTAANITSFKDLAKAKNVAAAVGTCAQISMYWAAQAAGIDYKTMSTVNIAPPLYRNAFLSGSIDAGIAWAPYSFQLADQGERLVGLDPDWVPGGGTCPETTLITEGALKGKPDLPRRLVEVQAEALAAIKKNPELAVKALVKRLSISEKIAKQTFERYFQDPPELEKHVEPTSRYALVGDKGLFAQLKLASETYVKLGVLNEGLSDEKIHAAIEPKYVQEYVKQHSSK